jgi:hypothetical protein
LRKISDILDSLKKHYRDDRPEIVELLRRLREAGLRPTPYNLTVHSYSNLTLDATLRQDGFAPGDVVHLTATLWEYRALLIVPATVWAEVVQPDGSRATLPFSRTSAGDYRADWPTTRPGVYRFRIRAEGRTKGNARFTRDKTLTAGVWAGGDQPYDPIGGGDPNETGGRDRYCRTILCLLEHVMKSPQLLERVKAMGLDLDGLRRCLERECRRKPVMEGRRTIEPSRDWRTLTATPEFARLLGVLASAGLADMSVLEPAKTTPVRRKPKMKGSDANMFLRPEQMTKKDRKPSKPKEEE